MKRRPEDRFATALAFARALEDVGPVADRAEVASWVEELAGREIDERAREVAALEPAPSTGRRSRRAPRARRVIAALGVVAAVALGLAFGLSPRGAPVAASPAEPAPEPPSAAPVAPPEEGPIIPTATSVRTKFEAPRRAVRRAPKPDCVPPFTIEDGRKVFKRECF